MKRLFWLGAGIAVGVLVVRKLNKTVQAYAPSSLVGSARESAVGLLDSVRDFVADVRDGMVERETQIHSAMEQGISLEDLDAQYADAQYDDEGGVGTRR